MGLGPSPLLKASQRFTLEIADQTLILEVAATNETRQRGLMHRKQMPEDRGMLFAYSTPAILHFWMKNTFLPLSIAFIADDGRIVNIENMEPLEELPGASSLEPVRYALEVNQGWFERNGVKAGDSIELPEWLEEIQIEVDGRWVERVDDPERRRWLEEAGAPAAGTPPETSSAPAPATSQGAALQLRHGK